MGGVTVRQEARERGGPGSALQRVESGVTRSREGRQGTSGGRRHVLSRQRVGSAEARAGFLKQSATVASLTSETY